MIGSRLRVAAAFAIALSFYSYGASERRPEDKVIEVNAKWSDRIHLLPNRGKQAVSPLAQALKVLSPDFVKTLSGYKNLSNTKFVLSTFDLRSREIVDAIELLLKHGASFDFYVDSINVSPIRRPTANQVRAWSESQKKYYIQTYDRENDPDGVVTDEDIAAWNFDKYLGIELWKRMKTLEKKFSRQLKLYPTPLEIVPKDENAAYPRIHHVKGIGIRFRSPRGKWQDPAYFLAGSANFTDTCMDSAGRILPTLENYKAYLAGAVPKRVPGTQGHIQFQADFTSKKGEEFIRPLLAPLENMATLYPNDKHFDEGPVPEKLYPKILFKDGSVLQAFYSEGTSIEGRPTADPIRLIFKKYLSSVDLELNKYYETQFVYTHHFKAAHMRQLLKKAIEHDTLEDAFIAVDGGFAEIPESALDDLLFADKVSIGDALRGRAIQRRDSLPRSFDWQKKVFSFVGDPNKVGNQRHSDKLHSKMMYIEYTDEFHIRHHLLVWGSGNSSANSGKLSFDVFFVLDTPDANLGKQIQNYMAGVQKETRLRPYYQTWLLRRFLESFGTSVVKLLNEDKGFVEKIAKYLGAKVKRKDTLESIYKQLAQLRTQDIFGKNIVTILSWMTNHPRLPNKMTWADWHLLLRLAHPFQKNFQNFRSDLEWFWIQSPHLGSMSQAEKDSQIKSFRRMLKKLEIDSFEDQRAVGPQSSRVDKIIAENLKENCEHFLGLDIDYYPHQIVDEWGEPGHGP